MARKPIIKELKSTRLANGYGGWIYCDHCGENIGYLCYVTYDNLNLTYQCKCGNQGRIQIAFDEVRESVCSQQKLIQIKNRRCCPADQSPLMTILEQKLVSYAYEIDCVNCMTKYREEKQNERNFIDASDRRYCRKH